ncbi:MAG: iron complex outermembrane receptor protein [Polyangiales bacterium]|jgi:iron complex outermembrane receptor protein
MIRFLLLFVVLWTAQAAAQVDIAERDSPDAPSDEAGEEVADGAQDDLDPASQIVPPRIVRSELPILPDGDFGDDARILRMELTIDAGGRLVATRWLEPLDDLPDALRAAAFSHVATLVFEAARRGDTPIASRVPYEIRFPPRLRLQESEAPEPLEATPSADPEPTEPEAADEAEEPEFGARAEIEAGTHVLPNASASERTLSMEMLRDVPRTSAEQMLAMAGVVLANHSGEGHASSLFLRGFDAGEGQDLEVLVDGIPLNEPSNAHLHGYADSAWLIPELVQNVRVLPGPFDVAQGDFALAGTAEYRLGLAERGFQLLGGYGSYRRRRALLLYGDGKKSFAGLEVQAGRGFGVNRAHRNIRAVARYSGGDDALGYSVTAASHALDFDSAGVVREDAVVAGTLPCSGDSQFFCTPDPNQGGAASRHLLAFSLWSRRPGITTRQSAWLQLRRSRFRENFTGFLLDERGDGLDEQTDGGNVGVRTDIQVQGTFGERELTLDFGLLARHDRIDTHIWRHRRADETPYRVVSENTLGLTTTAAYISAGFRSERVAVRAGARLAGFSFAMDDHNQPDVDGAGERVPSESRDAFGVALLPRATLVVALVKKPTSLDWVSSIGRGARSSDAAALSDGENAPFATSRSMETGFRLQHEAEAPETLAFDAQAGAFWTSVDRDLLFNPEAGRNTLVGRTERFGAFVNGRVRLTGWFEAVGSFTWSEAHLPGEDAGAFALTAGPRLPFVPRFVGRVDLALRREVKLWGQPVTFGAALGGGVLGRRPLPLNNLGERIATLDASARVRWRFVEFALLARNLTDNRYRQTELHYESNFNPEGLASLRAARHFAAGAPREIFATLTLFLDTDLLRFGTNSGTSSATNSETNTRTNP